MLTPDEHYANALSDICASYEALRPPRRLSVSQGAAANLFIKQPGGYVGQWSADETPYMSEPMDMLASRRHEAVCFVGPARTGKTMGLLEGWGAHVIVNDPGDLLIVQMTQDKAREYSKTRIDRMLRHSPHLAALKSTSAQDDNTHDKMFRHGMWLRVGWPTVSQLSSSDYRYVGLTDYDRMPADIDGEGSAFALGLKRTTTFLSRGMCMVESSPGYDVTDPNWQPVTSHEAPPADGVLSIYNRGDRRRWYWKCRDCHEWFEAAPGIGLFGLPPRKHLVDIVREADLNTLADQYAKVICPHCGSIIEKRHKHELNRAGRWLQDGLSLTSDDEVVGQAMVSSIASYWLGGVAAAYQPWKSLVLRYLQGLREYALAGSELTLRTTTNTDQGMPYTPVHMLESAEASANPATRGDATMERHTVPAETRYLTAQVDVQGGSGARFEVQIHAHGPNYEQWMVNRFAVKDSRRPGVGTEWAPIDPASYPEDWDRLVDEVLLTTYKTPIEGVELRVLMTAIDSGGEAGKDAEGNKAGVTANAYAFYRRLRARGDGLHERVMLTKGRAGREVPMYRKTLVGGRTPAEKGDVPLHTFNTDLMKDAVDSCLKRTVPGPGYIHFPVPKGPKNPDGWLPMSFFDELKAEVRDKTGKWHKIRKRNEALDLFVMARVISLRLGVDKIKDWSRAPKWAAPLEQNDQTISRQDRRDMRENAVDQSAVAAAAAVKPMPLNRPAPRPRRRTVPSPYLS
ncbi:MAG: phage terminase large subunit family protein [Hydrogenophaga sp.]|nr:phage terminase large subunit family protein [Hydrogenophaga sp.]